MYLLRIPIFPPPIQLSVTFVTPNFNSIHCVSLDFQLYSSLCFPQNIPRVGLSNWPCTKTTAIIQYISTFFFFILYKMYVRVKEVFLLVSGWCSFFFFSFSFLLIDFRQLEAALKILHVHKIRPKYPRIQVCIIFQ